MSAASPLRAQTSRLTMFALLIALTVVLTRWGSVRIPFMGVESMRIGIGALPPILAGVLYGPAAGFLVGAIGDVIGYLTSPMGGFNPWFTVTTGLSGAVPALVIWALGRRNRPAVWDLVLGIGVGQLVAAVILVPLGLWLFFGQPLQVMVPARFVIQALLLPVHVLLAYGVLMRVRPFWQLKSAEAQAPVR